MKQALLLISAGAIVLASCVGNPEGERAETTDGVSLTERIGSGNELVVDATASTIEWHGKKVSGAHHGTVDVKSGALFVDEGNVTGGNFVIDLNTINDLDLEGEWKDKLESHLKSDDFFDVENHPEAMFEITGVAEGAEANVIAISGNLTIRGITKNITFDAHVEEASNTALKASADFNILREDWGVSYAGQADDLISKEINLKITLVAGA